MVSKRKDTERKVGMTIVFRFRDGFELPVECESFECSTNVMTGQLNTYKIKGITDNKPLFISLDDVVCIWKKVGEQE